MTPINLKVQNLSDKDFSGLDFKNNVFDGVDFRESVFNGAHFKKVRFVNCNLQNTEFTEATLKECTFSNCNLNNSDFVYTTTTKITFEDCSFSHVEWRENRFENNFFKNCSFHNATVSLCTFKSTSFDLDSSVKFYGASKRYNVFLNSPFELYDEKIDFLKNNYGIALEDKNHFLNLEKAHKKEPFLVLSSLKYCNQITSILFVETISTAVTDLIKVSSKSRIQKAKYITLICKSAVDENDLSVIGLQILINVLNESSKRIKDTSLFMELVDLIVYLKTAQYKSIISISSKYEKLLGVYSNTTQLKIHLDNTYKQVDIQKYVRAMESFTNVHHGKGFKITSYKTGSTTVELLNNWPVNILLILVFLEFTLSKVDKSLTHLVGIKKKTKKLFVKESAKKKKTEDGLQPLSIMTNEGNQYYVQINNVVHHFGKDAIRVDGSGKININIDTSPQKRT